MTEQEAQQELAFIKKVMDDSRKAIVHDGKEFIAWGVLVALGMLIMYFKGMFDLGFSTFLLWGVIVGGGWLYSGVHNLRHRRQGFVRTFGAKILGAVWFACGVVMTTIGFVATSAGAIGGGAIIPLMCLVIGSGYFVTGVIYGSAWIRNSSLGWWVGAVIMLYWPGYYMFLLFAGMMVAFQIVPGIFFYRKWKEEIQNVPQ